ncbi:MAG: ABC transporter ATP-binding protein [Candidatus Scalindua sp.]|nr:ABC transporter ATP-binding protein [Candidatus Scalindua sp.]
MSETVIKVENLSKQYRIGAHVGYKTFRDTIVDVVKTPFRRIASIGKPVPQAETIWALNKVSFNIKKGEIVGIIGRNGAGKSTILKILSKITEPTEGRIELTGRVGSLLEVGTGFHPELTGHENIYLYGAILGMDRWEVTRKFDEIVSFAEIEQFVDTPVKRYSSGMYMRLAFAVAAHLEPEILVVDEVLAVGDAAFQKKCLGKMGEVAEGGRTVLFVSHNMGAIETLCNKGILLESGKKVYEGKIHEVVSKYLSKSYDISENPLRNCKRTGNGKIRVVSFHLESPDGEVCEVAKSGEPLVFCFEFENTGNVSDEKVSFSFSVHTDKELGLFHYYSHFSDVCFQNLPQKGWVKCLIPEICLAPGNFLVMCYTLVSGEKADWPQVFLPMTVIGADFFGTGNANLSTWGPILVKGKWFLAEV